MTSNSENEPLDIAQTSVSVRPIQCTCKDEKACKEGAEATSRMTFELSQNMRNRNACDADLETCVVPVALPRVPDGGWGWMVAVGSFIVMMLVPMLFPCFGILFSGYLLERGASSITTAWIFNILGFIWNIMGLFVQPLVEKFGWRSVGFAGITLVSTSLIVSAFAPSPAFLFFSLSLLSGIGGGLVTTMCFLIVPIYFEKRRGMANAIMMTGICSGEILGPLLVRLLLDEYSFLGANLIVGAILLNGFVGILFFHPVEWHLQRYNYEEQSVHHESTKPLVLPSNDKPKGDAMMNLHGDDLEKNELGAMLRDSAEYKDQKKRASIESLSLHHDWPGSSWTVMSSNLRGGYRNSLPENLNGVVKEENLHSIVPPVKRSCSVILATYRLLKRAMSDLNVLRSPRAAIIAIGNMLCMNSVMNFVMMVPFAMQALDYSLQDAAWCISVSAICNLLTRLVVSPLSDWARFSMKICYMGGYAMLALTMLIFPMLSDLKWLEVVMGFFGCALGANMALYNLVMIEYMGVENLAPVFGASGLMVGTGFLFFGTISGLVRDVSGSYKASMWMLSAMSATSFLLWFLMPSAVAYDERVIQKEKDNGHKTEKDSSDDVIQPSKGS